MDNKFTSVSEFLSQTNVDNESYFNEEFLQNIISYINDVLIPNLMSNHLDDDLNDYELHQFHKLFYNEICFILFKLCRLFERNRLMNEFVMIDLKNTWFKGERMILNKETSKKLENPFSNNKIISQTLTICTKLIDLISQVYETKITYINDKIQAVTDLYKIIFKRYYNLGTYVFDTEYHAILDTYNHEYMEVWEVSKTIRSYYMSLFYHIQCLDTDAQGQYYSHIPECIFNTFTSSLYFIPGDHDFVEFIQNVYSGSEYNTGIMVPPSFRYKYLLSYHLNATDSTVLLNRNDIMIDDIIYLYNEYKTDSSILMLDCSVQILKILNDGRLPISHINSIRPSFNKLFQLFTIICSHLLELSNSQDLKFKDKTVIIKYCNILLSYMGHILHEVPSLLNSYLVYCIPKCISTIDKTLLVDLNIENIINIYDLLLNHKYGIYYLIGLIDQDDIILKKMNLSENMRTFMGNIFEKSKNAEMIDEITCQPIIVPFYLPPKNILCDRYMTESYLWNKSENPYTREPLTINQLKEYNNSPAILEKIEETSKTIQSHFNI